MRRSREGRSLEEDILLLASLGKEDYRAMCALIQFLVSVDQFFGSCKGGQEGFGMA